MEKKTGYDAVVFDMDGVIFDSERAVMQCWKELADKYQIAKTNPGRFLKDSGRISYRKKQGARDHRHCRPDTGSI